MKKMVCVLAFVLTGTFAFANSSQIVDARDNGITVYTSCGEVGTILTQEGDTMLDILEMVNEMEEWLCG